MIFLAHRGFWRLPEAKNTLQAFKHAFKCGFGVELDVRDANGSLVISHDPVNPVPPPLLFRDVMSEYVEAGMPGYIAINIKADGLTGLIQAAYDDFPGVAGRCFVFDMSVPELIRYTESSVTTFTRHSDHEAPPSLLSKVSGVWMDSFDVPSVDTDEIVRMLREGKRTAIVSPELHGRPHIQFWEALRGMLASGEVAGIDADDILLCTDMPDEAALFFDFSAGKAAGL